MINAKGLVKRFEGRDRNAVDELDLEVGDGQMVSLLGPSGCGKTTTLRLLAGLERPDAGQIEMSGTVVADPARRIFRSAQHRPVGIVFQSYAIWPHMTVLDNVRFPLTSGRMKLKRRAADAKAREALELVGLESFAEHRAPQLSGGQQQRVALARALVCEPDVLLLDEPLSNLDAGLRGRVRDEIRAMQQRLGITTVFVTHDQEEALAVSDRVVLMSEGQIVEEGLPEEIYTWPRRPFTAQFLGISNHVSGTVRNASGGSVGVSTPHGLLTCPSRDPFAVGQPVEVFFRPSSLHITRGNAGGQAWAGKMEFGTFHGDAWDYHVRVGDDVFRCRQYAEKIGLSAGDPVWVEADPAAAIIIAADNPDEAERGATHPPVQKQAGAA